MRTTVWLSLALIAAAEISCTRPTPGYCGPGKGPDVCLAEGMVCNPATNLCEPRDAGTSERDASADATGGGDGGGGRDGATDARDGGGDADATGPSFKPCQETSECPTGKTCVDGVCCSSQTCGTCQSCAMLGYEGTCTNLPILTEDPNSGCSGDGICNGAGQCKKTDGQPCDLAAECASLACADGVCCNQVCDGTCYACNGAGNVGVCRPLHNVEDAEATAPCTGANICVTPAGSAPACKLKDGQSCTGNETCANNSCFTSYEDADADGYGRTGIRRCGTAPPPGYVTTAGDCCDMDARAHPGVTTYSNTENECGNFEFNCDGMVEKTMAGAQSCGCVGSGSLMICVGCR